MTELLPLPSPYALEISKALEHRIRDEIENSGGWIPFARFMELALYAPGLGYYSAGAAKLGTDPEDGSDFTTAPEMTPLFARALARPIAAILARSAPEILEFGAGSGKLAADLLQELERLDALPTRYALLEVSADLRERQSATLALRVPHLAARLVWLDSMPERIAGVVLGNEVLDAMPVQCIVRQNDSWCERGVGLDHRQALAYAIRPAGKALSTAILAAIPNAAGLPDGYLSEIHGAASAFIHTVVERLVDDGGTTALFIDYGFPAHEYYHPQRNTGTLMAHYRHRAHGDLLRLPGLQDLTAHVDFSAIAAAARNAQGRVLGYASQAEFLIDCGIATLLEGTAGDAARWGPQASALQKLLSEAEMGELFKVIALGKGSVAPPGFVHHDRSDAL